MVGAGLGRDAGAVGAGLVEFRMREVAGSPGLCCTASVCVPPRCVCCTQKRPGEAGSRVKCPHHNKIRKSAGPAGRLPSLLVFALSPGAAPPTGPCIPWWPPGSPSTLSAWSMASPRLEREGTFHKSLFVPQMVPLRLWFPWHRGN